MSFTRSLTGESSVIATVNLNTNVCASSVSTINLSATNASFTNITTNTWTAGNVSTSNMIATNGYVSNLYVSNQTISSLNISTLNICSVYSSNMYSSNASITNLSTSFINASTVRAYTFNSSFSNVCLVDTSTLYSTYGYVSNFSISNLSVDTGTITTFTGTSANISNLSVSNMCVQGDFYIDNEIAAITGKFEVVQIKNNAENVQYWIDQIGSTIQHNISNTGVQAIDFTRLNSSLMRMTTSQIFFYNPTLCDTSHYVSGLYVSTGFMSIANISTINSSTMNTSTKNVCNLYVSDIYGVSYMSSQGTLTIRTDGVIIRDKNTSGTAYLALDYDSSTYGGEIYGLILESNQTQGAVITAGWESPLTITLDGISQLYNTCANGFQFYNKINNSFQTNLSYASVSNLFSNTANMTTLGVSNFSVSNASIGTLTATTINLANVSVSNVSIDTALTCVSASVSRLSSTSMFVSNLSASNISVPGRVSVSNISATSISATGRINCDNIVAANNIVSSGTVQAPTGSFATTNTSTINVSQGVSCSSVCCFQVSSTSMATSWLNASNVSVTNSSITTISGTTVRYQTANFSTLAVSNSVVNMCVSNLNCSAMGFYTNGTTSLYGNIQLAGGKMLINSQGTTATGVQIANSGNIRFEVSQNGTSSFVPFYASTGNFSTLNVSTFAPTNINTTTMTATTVNGTTGNFSTINGCSANICNISTSYLSCYDSNFSLITVGALYPDSLIMTSPFDNPAISFNTSISGAGSRLGVDFNTSTAELIVYPFNLSYFNITAPDTYVNVSSWNFCNNNDDLVCGVNINTCNFYISNISVSNMSITSQLTIPNNISCNSSVLPLTLHSTTINSTSTGLRTPNYIDGQDLGSGIFLGYNHSAGFINVCRTARIYGNVLTDGNLNCITSTAGLGIGTNITSGNISIGNTTMTGNISIATTGSAIFGCDRRSTWNTSGLIGQSTQLGSFYRQFTAVTQTKTTTGQTFIFSPNNANTSLTPVPVGLYLVTANAYIRTNGGYNSDLTSWNIGTVIQNTYNFTTGGTRQFHATQANLNTSGTTNYSQTLSFSGLVNVTTTGQYVGAFSSVTAVNAATVGSIYHEISSVTVVKIA